MDNKFLLLININLVDLIYVVFLCDLNGKYFNIKMFLLNKNIEYFRCFIIVKVRVIIYNDLSDFL